MYKLISFFLITVSVYAEITPIPLTVEYNKVKAELGKKLFFDPIL